jgi:hypothetical protein
MHSGFVIHKDSHPTLSQREREQREFLSQRERVQTFPPLPLGEGRVRVFVTSPNTDIAAFSSLMPHP